MVGRSVYLCACVRPAVVGRSVGRFGSGWLGLDGRTVRLSWLALVVCVARALFGCGVVAWFKNAHTASDQEQ